MSGECNKCGEHCLECSCHHQSWGKHIQVDISHIPNPTTKNAFEIIQNRIEKNPELKAAYLKELEGYAIHCEPVCPCKHQKV